MDLKWLLKRLNVFYIFFWLISGYWFEAFIEFLKRGHFFKKIKFWAYRRTRFCLLLTHIWGKVNQSVIRSWKIIWFEPFKCAFSNFNFPQFTQILSIIFDSPPPSTQGSCMCFWGLPSWCQISCQKKIALLVRTTFERTIRRTVSISLCVAAGCCRLMVCDVCTGVNYDIDTSWAAWISLYVLVKLKMRIRAHTKSFPNNRDN